MFRRRIYAQGFTLLAVVGGSAYWENDRKRRKQFEELSEEKKQKDKHQAWIRELEIREQEEAEMQKMKDRVIQGRKAEQKGLTEKQAQLAEKEIKKEITAVTREATKTDGSSITRSVLEAGESRHDSRMLTAALDIWKTR